MKQYRSSVGHLSHPKNVKNVRINAIKFLPSLFDIRIDNDGRIYYVTKTKVLDNKSGSASFPGMYSLSLDVYKRQECD